MQYIYIDWEAIAKKIDGKKGNQRELERVTVTEGKKKYRIAGTNIR